MSEWEFLWGLEEELMDAIASGGTYDDCFELSQKKKNTMVFIDAENVSCSYVASIENELRNIGEVEKTRYYAMQKDIRTAGWKEVARHYGYKPILMSGERTKNKIDLKIIKDAKRVLFNNKSIDIFCIVSRDGDYKELVKFLRDNGKRVVILGPKGISKKLKDVSNEIRIIN